jgi:hypothetical protein
MRQYEIIHASKEMPQFFLFLVPSYNILLHFAVRIVFGVEGTIGGMHKLACPIFYACNAHLLAI